MIQRKQSIYFLVAAILTSVLLFTKLVDFTGANGLFALKHDGVFQIINNQLAGESILKTNLLMVFVIASALVSFVTIFIYKKRKIQILLSVLNFTLQIGIIGLIYYYANVGSLLTLAAPSYKVVAVFPLIALVLTYLAIMSIKKDDDLIKSLNRIR
jgi:hypothetical protein